LLDFYDCTAKTSIYIRRFGKLSCMYFCAQVSFPRFKLKPTVSILPPQDFSFWNYFEFIEFVWSTILKLLAFQNNHCRSRQVVDVFNHKNLCFCSSTYVDFAGTMYVCNRWSCFTWQYLRFTPRLPDGIVSYQKYQFGYILEGIGMKFFVIFYGHLEHFTSIWYISWPFGKFWGPLVYPPPRFGMLYREKCGKPGSYIFAWGHSFSFCVRQFSVDFDLVFSEMHRCWYFKAVPVHL
jgi:hypothetical protein